jgi:hypothetical protein
MLNLFSSPCFFIILFFLRYTIRDSSSYCSTNLMPGISSYGRIGAGCPFATISRNLGATHLPHTAFLIYSLFSGKLMLGVAALLEEWPAYHVAVQPSAGGSPGSIRLNT